MTRLAIILLTAAVLTACGAEPESAATSTKPSATESSATPTEAVGAPREPSMTTSQIVQGLGLRKPTAEYRDWGEWTYTTTKGVTCGVEQILIGQEKVALFADAGDTVANNGETGLVLVGDPYGDSDDGGYAIEKACYDELTTKMATMIGG